MSSLDAITGGEVSPAAASPEVDISSLRPRKLTRVIAAPAQRLAPGLDSRATTRPPGSDGRPNDRGFRHRRGAG